MRELIYRVLSALLSDPLNKRICLSVAAFAALYFLAHLIVCLIGF